MNRFFKIVLFGAFGLFLIVCAVFFEENWRGRCAWQECKGQLEAAGEKLEGRYYIPAPVPDEHNFAMAPLFAPLWDLVTDPTTGEQAPRDPKAVEHLKEITLTNLGPSAKNMPALGVLPVGKIVQIDEWQRWIRGKAEAGLSDRTAAAKDVLTALQKYSTELDQFSRAAERPFARFPLQYEKGFTMPLPHVQVLTGFSGVFCLRAVAEIEAGEPAPALQDAKTLDRVQAALRVEPLLISHLVRLNIISYLPQVLAQGLPQHRWTDEQLRAFQDIFSRMDLLADYQRVMRAERAILNDYFAQLHKRRSNIYTTLLTFGIQDARSKPDLGMIQYLPQPGLLYQNQAWHNRWIQDLVIPVVDPAADRVYPRRQAAAEEIERQTKTTPYNFLAKLTQPVYPTIAIRDAVTHMLVRETMVACALERFYLKNGRYPENMNELVPSYLSVPEQDVFMAELLHYHPENDHFILYSIGWNETDDGGTIVTKPNSPNRRDDQQGDWVWTIKTTP